MDGMELKDAYLIMCHGEYNLLIKLLKLLDDKNNDIYIHVDSKWRDFPFEDCKNQLKYSNIVFAKRKNVQWGGSSQIDAEISLLEEAIQNEHRYYHLLSGVDLPIKKKSEIDAFFRLNYGNEFIEITNVDKEMYYDRIKYYYFFQNYIGKNKGIIYKILNILQNGLLLIQQRLHIVRNIEDIQYFKGPNWFSITHDMAKYTVKQKKWIKKRFKFTFCADEIFLQTIALNSIYISKVTGKTYRHIDWKRGYPYIFRAADFNELINSENIFARKFDEKIDFNIINRIVNYVQEKDE